MAEAADRIIDVHGHLGRMKEFFHSDVSVETILGMMDRLHVDMMLQTHMLLLLGDDERGVSESVEAFEQSGGRILSRLVYDPRQPERSLELIRENIDTEPFVGVKIHPSWHLCPADSEAYDPVWKYVSDKNITLVTHSWDVSPTNPAQVHSRVELFEKYLERYPDVTLILAHSGGLEPGIRKAAELARRYPNVYLDIAGDILFFGLIEFLVENAGADKVLYGSDLTMLDPRINLGRVLAARIDGESKRKILGLKAMWVFGL